MNNIDVYYDSIKHVYDEINSWKPKPKPFKLRAIDKMLPYLAIPMVFSILPILPALAACICKNGPISIGFLCLGIPSFLRFLVTWLVLAIGSICLFSLFFWLDKHLSRKLPDESGPTQVLSGEQVTFLALYEAYKELRVYFVSHVDAHIDNALNAVKKVLSSSMQKSIDGKRNAHLDIKESLREEYSMERFYTTASRKLRLRLRSEFPRQIRVANDFLDTFEKYDWLQLQENTRSLLQALVAFPEKIPFRLQARQDLPAVLRVLESLSKFTYAYLPEHSTNMDNQQLQSLQEGGKQYLETYKKEIAALTPYGPQAEDRLAESTESKKSLLSRLSTCYCDYIAFRFAFWLIFLLLLTIAALYGFNQYHEISADTAATILIGTSVLGAAAMAGLIPRPGKEIGAGNNGKSKKRDNA